MAKPVIEFESSEILSINCNQESQVILVVIANARETIRIVLELENFPACGFITDEDDRVQTIEQQFDVMVQSVSESHTMTFSISCERKNFHVTQIRAKAINSRDEESEPTEGTIVINC